MVFVKNQQDSDSQLNLTGHLWKSEILPEQKEQKNAARAETESQHLTQQTTSLCTPLCQQTLQSIPLGHRARLRDVLQLLFLTRS